MARNRNRAYKVGNSYVAKAAKITASHDQLLSQREVDVHRPVILQRRTLTRFIDIINNAIGQRPIKYSELKERKRAITGLSDNDLMDVVVTVCKGQRERVYKGFLMVHVHGAGREDYVISPLYSNTADYRTVKVRKA